MTIAKCSRNDCNNTAFKTIAFHIYGEVGITPITGNLGIKVCEACATEELLKTIFVENPEGRKLIESKFKHHGLIVPCWNRSYAEWVDIESVRGEMKQLQKAQEKRIRKNAKRQFGRH